MNLRDTIIAPATAIGGSIAVIRISGDQAYSALTSFFHPSSKKYRFSSHRLYHGHLHSADGHVIDEIMAVYMAAPKTYTRQDIVEIHCHASSQVVKEILRLFESFGLRHAEPGEFTYRAFINGRLDLAQAEAVSQLIQAKSESAQRLAISQLDGALSQAIQRFTRDIKNIVVLLEAWIDFPEEDLPQSQVDGFISIATVMVEQIERMLATYSVGRVLKEGVSIVLAGEPNAGKSSLLNYLLGEDRAIVTDIPGTTRDILEENLLLGGLPIRLIDTAGLRDSDDPIEAEGIRRAQDKLENADLILFLIDSSKKPTQRTIDIIKSIDRPYFIVLTKSDLGRITSESFDYNFSTQFTVSIKSGQGTQELVQAISDQFLIKNIGTESVLISERRHFEVLNKAHNNINRFVQGVGDMDSLELLSFELREALYYLGQISGETTTEDLLTEIFSGFCIGK